ncbi:MAG: outer membrane protein assembly factor BamE [Cellvibrionales bacterium]|nr:outer membrane protein assembly factor BamE [Cellvibrionales bacterium]
MHLKAHVVLTLLVALLAGGGCSNADSFRVHRIHIQQGNLIDQDMVAQLKIGMTQAQVRFVLGTPLAADTFNPRRWDYPYSLKKGDAELARRVFSVFFDQDGTLSHFSDSLKAGDAGGSGAGLEAGGAGGNGADAGGDAGR